MRWVVTLGLLGLLAQSRPSDSVQLGPTYLNPSFGFSLRPPAGWGIDDARDQDLRETTVLRLTPPAADPIRGELVVRTLRLRHDLTAQRVLEDDRALLAARVGEVSLLSAASQPLDGRPAARQFVRFIGDGRPLVQLQSAVRVAPGAYFVITYAGPAESLDRSAALFDAVVGSFTVLADEASNETLRAAVRRSSEWRQSVRDVDLSRHVQPPLCLRIRRDGRDVGYIEIEEEPHPFQDADGVRIVEEGWTFEESGAATLVANALFLSQGFEVENWEHRSASVVPATSDRPLSMETVWEQAVRENDVLVTAQTYRHPQDPQPNAPMKVPEAYLPRLLARWLPRLADPSRPGLYAFSQYDHARAGLVVRTVEFRGADTAAPTGVDGPAYLVVEREGLTGEPVQTWTDRRGRILRVQAGTTIMEPADLMEMQPRWQKLMSAAARDMRKVDESYSRSLYRLRGEPPER